MKLINSIYFRYVLLVFAGFLSIYAFAPYNHSICIIISLLLLTWIINQITPKLSALHILSYGFCYGYVYFIAQIHWIYHSLYKIIGANLFISIVAVMCFSAFLSLYITIAIFSYIKLKTTSKFFNYLFLFPSIWVLFEWFRGWFLGGFAWSDIGYTQVNNEIFHGFFAVFGEYGVSWVCISLVNSIYLILENGLKNNSTINKRTNIYWLNIIYFILIISLGYSIKSVTYTKPYGKPISVALVQGNISANSKWLNSDDRLAFYLSTVKDTKADIILFPETGISQFEADLPNGYLNQLEYAALYNHANLIVGMPVIIDRMNNYVNAAIILTNKGRPYYAKSHLVPFGEYIPLRSFLKPLYKLISLPMVGFSRGNVHQKSMVVGNQKIAFNICFENGFASELISSAQDSTLMVNLSDMIWYGETMAMDQHLQLSQARALENQRYFIQETNTSITAIITPDGKVKSRLPVFRRAILKDYAQGMVGITPYQRFGNWLIIIFCTLVIFISWVFNKNNFSSILGHD